ncbi:IPExxxVDY family protein [Flavobacterium sp. RSB2_4_14]|uniref:IPExxxVDY family protein n=1 Tax=Flavobacterium sp. RSB2_4_14 TaxID=3447665 RepID=UPI003F398D6F
MIVHKMSLDEMEKAIYQLVAIHTSLEDYRLAYFINQNLPINLKKCHSNIQIRSKEGEAQLSRFEYEDEKKNVLWNLVQNKSSITNLPESNSQDLFANSNSKFSSKIYLLPEFKKVDYFLKIENEEDDVDITTITNLINKIERVSIVYNIELQTIKSKNNLIF